MAARVCAEQVDEVGVQRPVLQSAGRVRREQPLDASFAVFGLAAERELAVDDGAPQSAFGVVVGRRDALDCVERPQCRPDLEDVAREAAGVAVARGLAGVAREDRLQLTAQLADAALELGSLAGVLVDLPGPEQAARRP